MSNRKLRIMSALAVIGFLVAVPVKTLHAAKLGKIFIKAAPPEGVDKFVDPGLDDTVKDLKSRKGDFVLVNNEADADFLMVVVNRNDTPVSGQPTAKRVTVTLSTREGASWKPGIRITKVANTWSYAARNTMGDAQKWVKENLKIKK